MKQTIRQALCCPWSQTILLTAVKHCACTCFGKNRRDLQTRVLREVKKERLNSYLFQIECVIQLKEGFRRKLKSWSYLMLRYINLFLTQMPCFDDEGKLKNLSSTFVSTAKLTTSSRRQAKCKKKYESENQINNVYNSRPLLLSYFPIDE